MANTFILSDESVNDRGFRILTGGIDTGRFESNPVMLWMHQRDMGMGSAQVLPIGRWENIRKEDGKLMADPVFDENDRFAQLVKSKVENGFVRGASIGVRVKNTSEEENYLLKGQNRATVTECEIYEASIVDVPANKNTVQLFSQNETTEEIPLIINKLNMATVEKTQLSFDSEAALLDHMKEKFGFEPQKEEKDDGFKFNSEEDARNWFQKLFGLQPKAKAEKEPAPETEINPQVDQLQANLQTKDSEIENLKAQIETLKNAPAVELNDTAEATDDAPEASGEMLSMRDIELFNMIKQ